MNATDGYFVFGHLNFWNTMGRMTVFESLEMHEMNIVSWLKGCKQYYVEILVSVLFR